MDRLRALELPARGRPLACVRRRRPPQPRARPPRPARHFRCVPRREAPHLRARARQGRSARLRDRRDRVLRRRPAAGGATDSRAPQPGERRRRDRSGPRRRRARRRDRRGTRHVPRSPAPAGAGARAARRSLGQRLEGDEHRGGPPRRSRLRRTAPPHPRRLAQGRGLRPLRARPAGERPLDLSRRGGDATSSPPPSTQPDARTSAPATSPPPWRRPQPTPSPATSSSSRRPAPATTSSRTSRRRGDTFRRLVEEWHERRAQLVESEAPARSRPQREATNSSGTSSCSSRRRSSSSVSSWCTARPRVRRARERQPAGLRRAAGDLRRHRRRAARRRLASRRSNGSGQSRRASS